MYIYFKWNWWSLSILGHTLKLTCICIALVLHNNIIYHHSMKHSMNTLFCDSQKHSFQDFRSHGGEMRSFEIYRRTLIDERYCESFQNKIRFPLNICFYVPPKTWYPVTNLLDVTMHISSGGLEVIPVAIMKFSIVSSGMWCRLIWQTINDYWEAFASPILRHLQNVKFISE